MDNGYILHVCVFARGQNFMSRLFAGCVLLCEKKKKKHRGMVGHLGTSTDVSRV